MKERLKQRVHTYYWEQNKNCATTMLLCLAEQFHISLTQQTLNAAIGMHGAGGYRAQCGLVEGALMFIGIYFANRKTEEEIVRLCFAFAERFNNRFGSLVCKELRPQGFQKGDVSHVCEPLTVEAIAFTCQFLQEQIANT